ncbi:mitochondrial carrier domain-containing protein [Leucosporidium creatinivorum]|uniref:Mitochondrial carrier domain-containing protein n=1 Tax=Leucosporidium creatinivorum TaxID=106004 RepID=A0A1Y2G0S4_9BASI|nr:mitochondrial carrier domain-containing protein [Leucosporidium creatinivorum]
MSTSPSQDLSAQAAPRAPSTLSSLIAGSFGGMAQVLSGQPLDTIKTRAQTSPAGQFKGPLDIAVQTIKKEGFLGLYKGMASPLLGVAGVNSLLFASNAYARKLVSPYGPNLSISEVATAGAIAGAAQSILASPVEMFKVRMQAQYGPNPRKLREIVAEMYTKYGWKQGIFRGYWITVVREIPAYGGFYAGYEYTKRSFQKSLHTDELPVWATLTSGAMGGVAYWTACYPLDVVKSRIQLQEAPPGRNYIINTFAKIYREEGAAAFVRGLTPTCDVPAAATTFLAFELAMGFIQKNTNL